MAWWDKPGVSWLLNQSTRVDWDFSTRGMFGNMSEQLEYDTTKQTRAEILRNTVPKLVAAAKAGDTGVPQRAKELLNALDRAGLKYPFRPAP